MNDLVQTRTPMHLWIVGGLATLWNAMGCYDYLMTRMRNMEYLGSMGVDANAVLAWIDGFPMYAQFGWGLGVWAGLAGSLALLLRSRHAVWLFALSLLGIALGIGYQIIAAPPLAGADEGIHAVMPYAVILIGVLLLVYSRAQAARGVLR